MDSWQSWYQSTRRRRALARWAAQGHLAPGGLEDGRAFIGDPPDALDWRRFWLTLCGWLGVCLIAAAAVSFIAANWSAMGRYARLGLAEAALVVAAGVALAVPRSPRVAKLALWLACALIGVLFALIGQVYQLGADPWQLFALWAGLMLPWAIASRHPATWLLFTAVAELAVWLWAGERLRTSTHAFAFGLFNLALLVVWEIGRRHLAWLAGHDAGPRLTVLALLTGTSWLALPALLGSDSGWAWLPWLACAGAVFLYYLHVRRDLAVLALVLLDAIVMFTVHLGVRVLDNVGDAVAAMTMLALLVLGQAALAAAWLRRLGRAEIEP